MRVRSVRFEHVVGVVQQDTLEEHERKVIGELLEQDDVGLVVAVARFGPLDLLVEPTAEQHGPDGRDLVRPSVGGVHVRVDVGEVLHCSVNDRLDVDPAQQRLHPFTLDVDDEVTTDLDPFEPGRTKRVADLGSAEPVFALVAVDPLPVPLDEDPTGAQLRNEVACGRRVVVEETTNRRTHDQIEWLVDRRQVGRRAHGGPSSLGDLAVDCRQHRGRVVDRRHVGPGGDQPLGEYAGPAPEVDDAGTVKR